MQTIGCGSFPRAIPMEPKEGLSTKLTLRQKQVNVARGRHAVSEKVKAQRFAKAYERGRRECLAFCVKFHAALPRELRDMVYDQLIPPRLWHHVFEPLDEKGQPRVSSNPLVSASFFDPRSRIPEQPSVRRDIWRYREYVGDIVAKEVADRWYHTGLFILDAEDALLPKFLSTDVWEQDNVPAEAVRHIRLNIRDSIFDDELKPDKLVKGFEHLFRVANKKTEIVFYMSGGYGDPVGWYIRHLFRSWQLQPLGDALELIRPTIYRLREEGYTRVRVQQGGCDVC
ncbi:uncharacterized protein K460DRAFT_412669 [Cucurbitaria berberidis CBS 394.84]|uniref:Uncharacterized protein n=1 Tax=Cucurbitaria berberidis CBS 394.84 TaxID=1168544 RepID=A0A9P4GU17_9PLEO|nr:uncharacterized protein K460DRAFT_412669 [Cucurbitaria berberidis CBS 394.84]KAF1851051.1 hypothetical protein K460DRAFT_412669 [Cucurbitaria berberidis CBS 394.84]